MSANLTPWFGDAARAQADANARLIAASPDLLAALQSMLSEFVGPHEEGFSSAMKARAAIARATGAA